ncbi:MAG: hypothetical protein CME17_00070 [Gemmatimonadetes bacterium]|nr:hypothetical protein [Gemmatimonadota bacterium]
MLIEVRVQSLWVDGTTNTPVVMLKELSGERVLPIWIGPGEASAIATELAAMEFARPLTHDLLCTVMKQLGGNLQRVIISRVEDSTYYAELSVLKNGEVISLDARPSDSIAIALRSDTQIFAHEELLEVAGHPSAEDFKSAGNEPSSSPPSMGPDELEEHLRRLNPEDFGRFTP